MEDLGSPLNTSSNKYKIPLTITESDTVFICIGSLFSNLIHALEQIIKSGSKRIDIDE